MLKCLAIVLLSVCSIVVARSASSGQKTPNLITSNTQNADYYNEKDPELNKTDIPSELNFWSDVTLLYKIYSQCTKDDLTVCLKIKLLAALEKALRTGKEFTLIDGIKFVQDNEIQANPSPVLSESDIKEILPRSLNEKEASVNLMLFEKAFEFIRSHTLQVKFPDIQELKRSMSGEEDGRRRKNKRGGAFIMIPLLLGGTFIPIAYGALALLAGKALIVSKLALVLASIIGIKKLLSGGGHKESQHEVVVSSGHSSGWGRELAYSAHEPDSSTDIEPKS